MSVLALCLCVVNVGQVLKRVLSVLYNNDDNNRPIVENGQTVHTNTDLNGILHSY